MSEMPVMKGVAEAIVYFNRNGNSEPWRLTTNLLAWDRLEKLTGKSAGAYVEDQFDFRLGRYCELAFAFTASHRVHSQIACTYEEFLEMIPADEAGLIAFKEAIGGLLRHSPFGRMVEGVTMSLILYLVKTKPQWVREVLDAQTGTISYISDSMSSDSAQTSSGTAVILSISESSS